MSISVSIHRCTGLRIESHYPNNGNSIRLTVKSEDDELDLLLFDLPVAITERLLHDFSDEATKIDHEVGLEPTGETT